jgi:DNA repair protein RadA/Sms
VRGIGHIEARVKEAAKMGFNRCVLPRILSGDIFSKTGISLIRISNLKELIDELF